MEPHQRRSEEIAVDRLPFATLPTATGILPPRYQPVAFRRRDIGKEVGIGRTGDLDETDLAQNKAPAALSAALPIGPMSR
ncbi:hypothetical protein FHS50_000891 [Sphingomicrobium lutaoense]|uniref:Uncharacterized protein n=1 Tax=Sphingomicrobium lutaoense TaxID=515949 RepID=A0A839YZW5_9SPHN|nr:hypothetical protein [Sphingomicrobium lutaoense]